MIKKLGRFLSSERGDMSLYVMMVVLLFILVIFTFGITFVWRLWIIKNQAEAELHQALLQAATSAGSYSVQSALDSGTNQVVINSVEAKSTFNAVLALDLGISSNYYTVDDFIVYGPADRGKPLPGGCPGVVPGTSIYAHITIEIPVGKVLGIGENLWKTTLYMPLDDLVAPNRFQNPLGQWQGG